ncbi:MAG: adenosylcobinamide-GDP ribazoletransferase [Spirochaetes bacterium]|nr:adenosylcobinamide-GDP ribazoletransferase [Spirochaetota bacterium]
MFKGFLLQLQFLTRIPAPVNVEFDEKLFSRGVIFAPVIGLLIGVILAGVYILADFTGRPIIAVIAVIIAEIIITGGLHLDGLADTFDGIFSNRPKEEILRIMKDSRIGTNGTLSLILLIVSKIGLMLIINKEYIIPCLVVMPVMSRMCIAWTAGISAYAGNAKSPAAFLVKNTGAREIIISTFIAVVPCAAVLKFVSVPAFIAVVVFAVLFTAYVKKKIGGITGDIIGAVIELSEHVFLFTIIICESTAGGI